MATDDPVKVHKSSRHRHRRKAAGICVSCSNAAESGLSQCRACLDKQKQISAERLARGLCYCGRPAITGQKRCPPCRDSIRKSVDERQARMLAQGLCRCGQPRQAGSTQCEACNERARQRYKKQVESGICRCKRSPIEEGKKMCRDCCDRLAAHNRAIRDSLNRGYGGRCSCCGDDDPNVLELDHVNDDGAEHRKRLSAQGVYRWAVTNGFPPSLQLLCANCHTAKTRTGDCSYRKNRGKISN